jgi:hypothetical protein
MSDWFNMYVRQVRALTPERAPSFDPNLDNVISLFHEVCGQWAASGAVAFHAGVLHEDWPVDVRTDLPVILDQLPSAVSTLLRGGAGSLEFFEQGVSRMIRWGIAEGGRVDVECVDIGHTASPKDTVRGEMDAGTLLDMLGQVRADFLRLVALQYPALDAEAPLVATWLRHWSLLEGHARRQEAAGSLRRAFALKRSGDSSGTVAVRDLALRSRAHVWGGVCRAAPSCPNRARVWRGGGIAGALQPSGRAAAIDLGRSAGAPRRRVAPKTENRRSREAAAGGSCRVISCRKCGA